MTRYDKLIDAVEVDISTFVRHFIYVLKYVCKQQNASMRLCGRAGSSERLFAQVTKSHNGTKLNYFIYIFLIQRRNRKKPW